MGAKLRVAAIPDMHLPFTDWTVVERVYRLLEATRPDVVIQLGDLYDQFAFSRFARSQDLMTPEEELSEGREGAVNFWATINKILPHSRKIQIKGNHDDRLLKRTMERFPEVYSLLSRADHELCRFEGVETILDSRKGVRIDDVLYIHGHLTKLGDHMLQLGLNVVHGHTHRAGTIFRNHFGQTLWELDCGYLADKEAVPLKYGPVAHTIHCQGIGWIDAHGPRFVPV